MDMYLGSSYEKKRFYKILMGLVLPIAFQNLMSAAVSASDALMLGVISQEAMSAVSLAGQVTFVFQLFVTVFVQGTTLLVAQYWGKKDITAIEKIFGFVVKYMFVISFLFSILAIFCSEMMMRLLTSDAMLVQYGSQYLKVAGFSYIPLGLSQIYLCIMKNTERTLKSTVISVTSMVLNLVLNSLFIFILSFGIQGAAIATNLSMMVQLIWVMIDSYSQDISLKMKYVWKKDDMLYRDFIYYTLPVAGNYFFYGCGVTMYSVIVGHLGSEAVAAFSIVNIIQNLLTCFVKGLGVASGIVVGNALGEEDNDKAKLYGERLLIFAFISGIISGLVLIMLRPLIVQGVSSSIQSYIYSMIFTTCLYMIPSSIGQTIIGGVFCAGGQSHFGCKADGIVIWLVIIPLAVISGFVFQCPFMFVFMILRLDEWIKLPAVLWYFKKYKWIQNITR